MASTFINWLKSPKAREYFFSTHFWGPVANWGLPLAALADLSKDETVISGPMTTALAAYSMVFMRFAWRVQPRNYLLFACHFTNATAQLTQGARFVNYWYLGGREKKLGPAGAAAQDAMLAASKASEAGKEKVADVGEVAHELGERAGVVAREVEKGVGRGVEEIKQKVDQLRK